MEDISPHWLFLAFMALAALTVLASRLVSRSRGSLRAARGAEEEFAGGEADPDCRYYVAGSRGRPSALLAVHGDWTLQEGWTELPDPERDLPEAVEGLRNRATEGNRPLHALDLLDPQGARIGSWYGPLGPGPAVRVREGRRLSVEPPPSVHEP